MENKNSGKGDKWRKTDYKCYFDNYNEINWNSSEFTNCYNCGMVHKTADKYTKMQFIDGDWVCWKCNFN